MSRFEAVQLTAPQTAIQSGEWLEYVGTFSGVVGALFAGFAIWYAAWVSAQSRRDLIRERRLEFELNILAEIRRQMSITQLQHLAGHVAALIVDPADETDIPVLRAVLNVKSGPVGRQRRDELANGVPGTGDRLSRWLAEAQNEVDAAIQRRIEE